MIQMFKWVPVVPFIEIKQNCISACTDCIWHFLYDQVNGLGLPKLDFSVSGSLLASLLHCGLESVLPALSVSHIANFT